MKFAVVVFVVGALLFSEMAEGRPSRDVMKRLLAVLQRRSGGDCAALAESFDKMLSFNVNNAPVAPGVLRQLLQRATGIDLLNPAETNRVMCRLTEATTVRELYDAEVELGFILHALTAAYDAGIYYLPQAIVMLEPLQDSDWIEEPQRQMITNALELMHIVQESRLSNLDPEGVQWVGEIVNAIQGGRGKRTTSQKNEKSDFLRSFGLGFLGQSKAYDSRSQHRQRSLAKYKRTESDLCDRLATAMNAFLDSMSDSPIGSMVVHHFMQWTGVNLQDRDEVREIACTVSEVESIQEIIDYLDDIGVTNHLIHTGYTLYVQTILTGKARIEQMLESGQVPDEVRVQLRLALDFYVLVQENGLLSLRNDAP